MSFMGFMGYSLRKLRNDGSWGVHKVYKACQPIFSWLGISNSLRTYVSFALGGLKLQQFNGPTGPNLAFLLHKVWAGKWAQAGSTGLSCAFLLYNVWAGKWAVAGPWWANWAQIGIFTP